MWFATKSYLVALNALLAEHSLGLVELTPENPFSLVLRNAVISAFKFGARTRFDEQFWISKFNHESRLIQLNFVAFGLDQLDHHPYLDTEEWPPVRNPFLARNAEGKLGKAVRYIKRKHGVTVHLKNSRLAILEWGLADIEAPNAPQESKSSPNILFMTELPHPDHHRPLDVIRSGSQQILYYENVRTSGEIITGGPALYKYPQVAVIIGSHQQPPLIVRVEESSFGSRMLCSIDSSGARSNFGSYSATSKSDFLMKTKEIAARSKNW